MVLKAPRAVRDRKLSQLFPQAIKAGSGVLTFPLIGSFASLAESLASFAVKDFDLRSHLKGQNRKPQRTQRIPQRTQSRLN
jgi:hypothetical protein